MVKEAARREEAEMEKKQQPKRNLKRRKPQKETCKSGEEHKMR
jgi:hypothetical protein